MILTSNQSFGSWGEVFGDRVIASAILDRILHHDDKLKVYTIPRLLIVDGDAVLSAHQPTHATTIMPSPWTRCRATTGTWTGHRTACPQAPTGVVVVVGIHKGVGEFSMTTPGEI